MKSLIIFVALIATAFQNSDKIFEKSENIGFKDCSISCPDSLESWGFLISSYPKSDIVANRKNKRASNLDKPFYIPYDSKNDLFFLLISSLKMED